MDYIQYTVNIASNALLTFAAYKHAKLKTRLGFRFDFGHLRFFYWWIFGVRGQ